MHPSATSRPRNIRCIGDVGDHPINHRVSAGDERLLVQAHARIVEDPHAELLIRRNDVDGVHVADPDNSRIRRINCGWDELWRIRHNDDFSAALSRRPPGNVIGYRRLAVYGGLK